MNIQELGKEYMERYEILMEKVSRIKQEYDSACPEVQRKSRVRIKELMSTAIYLKKTAEKLIGYYEKKSTRRYINEKKYTES